MNRFEAGGRSILLPRHLSCENPEDFRVNFVAEQSFPDVMGATQGYCYLTEGAIFLRFRPYSLDN